MLKYLPQYESHKWFGNTGGGSHPLFDFLIGVRELPYRNSPLPGRANYPEKNKLGGGSHPQQGGNHE